MNMKPLFSLTFIALMVFSSLPQAKENAGIIEWAPFEIKQGVSDSKLLQISERLQNEFLVKQKGYIKRELLKGKNHQWVDLIYWASEEDAKLAAQNAATCMICGEFFQLMVTGDEVDPSEGIYYFEKMASWE